MIEFEDLTPLDQDELINFYPVDWYESLTFPNPNSPGGFQVRPEYESEGLYKIGLFDRSVCGKEIQAVDWFAFNSVICLLRKGHPGNCLCWTRKDGIISQL